MSLKMFLILILILQVSACGVHAQRQFEHPTYEQAYREKIVRLALYLEAPMKDNEQSQLIMQLWALQSQKYINQHRDFLVNTLSASLVDAEAPFDEIEVQEKDFKEACLGEVDDQGKASQTQAVQGVIYLKGDLKALDQTQKQFKIKMQAELKTCQNQELLWQAQVEDEWDADDPQVSSVIQSYQKELGTSISPYIAPSFHAIRHLFDLLPYPKLISDSDIQEKIKLQ